MIEALFWCSLAAVYIFVPIIIVYSWLAAASRADDRADRLGYDMAVQREQARKDGAA